MMRKYGKWLLVVLGILLMFVFVGNLGTNSGSGDSSASVVRGTLNGKEITNGQIIPAANSFRILSTLGYLSERSIPGALLDKQNPEIHWYLLTLDTKRNGIYVSTAEVDEVFNARFTEPGSLEQFLAGRNITSTQIRSAISDLIATSKLINAAVTSIPVSLPQLEFVADATRATVKIDLALLEAEKVARNVPPPSPEAIQKQFNLYKGVFPILSGDQTEPPLIDGHRFPFGYKYPNRVKVEFLRFDRAAVRKLIKPTIEDLVEARRIYDADPSKFPNDDSKPPELDILGPSTAPATAATAASKPAYKTFDQVKQKLLEQQLDARAATLLNKMIERAQYLSQDPWRTAKVDEKGFREAIPQERWTSYKTIAEDIQKQRDFAGYLPTWKSPGDWLTEKSLATLEGIGNAAYIEGGTYLGFPQYASRIREILAENDPNLRLALQVGLDGKVVDENNNVYLFRVTAAQKAAEPASVDEVKPAVIADLQKRAAYEQLKTEAAALAQAARTTDLSTLAKEKGFAFFNPEPFTRLQPDWAQGGDGPLPGFLHTPVQFVGKVPGFVDAAFELTRKSTTQPAGKPTTVFASDARLNVYIIKLIEHKPLPIDEFEQSRPILSMLVMRSRRDPFLEKWIKIESVADRLNFIPDGGKF